MQVFNNILTDSLSKQAVSELKSALCTRGARSGLLKKSAPAHGKPGRIGWQAIMGELAPARVSIWSLLTMSAEEKALYEECEQYCQKFHHEINRQLQRPLEFNLYHFHN